MLHPTVGGLAALLEDAEVPVYASPLVPIQPHGARRPLFLLPGAGGHVLYFAHLARHLGRDQPVFGLESPGRYGEAPPPASVQEHATRLLDVLHAQQPHGPYRLLGHSAGSHVAFEMATQLEALGEEVDEIFILDSPAPVGEPAPARDGDAIALAIISVIEEFLGVSLGIEREEIITFPNDDDRYKLIADRLKLRGNGFDLGNVKHYAAVYAAMSDNHCRYRPAGRLACPITLIQAEDSVRPDDSPDWGWQAFASTPIKRRMMAGTHMSMMSEPCVGELARLIDGNGRLGTDPP